MIKEILDASKAEKTDMEDAKEVDLSELVERVAGPYQTARKSAGFSSLALNSYEYLRIWSIRKPPVIVQTVFIRLF